MEFCPHCQAYRQVMLLDISRFPVITPSGFTRMQEVRTWGCAVCRTFLRNEEM